MQTRRSVFHGMFYPSHPEKLSEIIDVFYKEVKEDYPVPKAMIAPHAGYIYSGQTAAYAFKCLSKVKAINHVIVVAPSHQYAFDGIAITKAAYFDTPLGKVSIDQKICKQLIDNFEYVGIDERAFDNEHALEVELPFLQKSLQHFTLTPLIVGHINPQKLSKVLLSVWNGPSTLIVVSSDLSHYHPYAIANKIDHATKEAIENILPDKIAFEQACGQTGILALLHIAKQKSLNACCVDLRNSGDTAGDRDRVVGYGAFHFYEGKENNEL
jgi:AmmeMemoRadiSam system protein B